MVSARGFRGFFARVITAAAAASSARFVSRSRVMAEAQSSSLGYEI
ncbi:hypothetical protein BURMUCF2_2056 [Burkholderia multivorans CF2]|nr:hypothetical protein BURMUCF2_2056 [Burkholderia multivorans CF2]